MSSPERRHDGAHGVPVLMIVHAHPDDESSQTGGTLARYAAAGCRTILVTCTDGAQGDASDGGLKPGDAGHDPRQVAATRSVELDNAAAALGVREIVKLHYPDSGMAIDGRLVDPDAFSRRPIMPMVGQLVRLMRLYRPDVVITYPPNGLSEHPDHVRTHEVVLAAHGNIVANAEPNAVVPRVYYIAMSASRLRAAQDMVRSVYGDDAWAPPAELGVADDEITTVIDIAPYWSQKLKALAAHASQPDAAMLLRMFSAADESAESAAYVEEYVRAYPASARQDGIEQDFFDPELTPWTRR